MDKNGSSEENREALLKEYVTRLSQGESLAAVRKDFVSKFQSMDASEIMKAEQNLISGGMPPAKVQKLCDVHSALFYGAVQEEKSTGAEIAGHPVNIFAAENDAISREIHEVRECLAAGAGRTAVSEKLKAFRAASVHYAEKGNLIYPLLKGKYGVTSPADVMWAVDDEIRVETKFLIEAGDLLPDYPERIDRLLTRAQEMVFKEKNILLPLCMKHFTDEDWMRIYYELSAYEHTLSGGLPVWEAAERRREELKRVHGQGTAGSAKEGGSAAGAENPVSLGSGHMTPEQIECVLNTIPMELTFIDENNINCFFNAGKKVFKRPDEAIGREVFLCHPPKYAAMAKQIIDELKSGVQDSVDIWMTKGGGPLFVRYMAVRNQDGKYVGTLECVQKMKAAKKYFAETEKAGKRTPEYS